jgi:hypothetical protein
MSFKHVTNAASLGIDFVEYHLDAMSRQVLRKLRTGPPGVDTARVAGRLKSQATITVSSANDPARFRVCGNTTVGRPEPKMMDSAYH